MIEMGRVRYLILDTRLPCHGVLSKRSLWEYNGRRD